MAKTTKKTAAADETPANEGNETMTTTEMFEQFTDPGAMLQAHRKLAMATFDNVAEAQAQTRKLVEESFAHSLGPMDDLVKPLKHASEQMTAAGFDLHKRALEVTRSEVERLYDAATPN